MRGFRASLEPLRERPFRLLFLGRTLSNAGDAIVPLALVFAALEIGDATDLGLVLASFSASRVVFLVAGGVWADRLPRQLVMMAADAARAVVQALLAVAFFTDAVEVWQLAAGSALFGVASAFFNPASTGLVPSLVSRRRLQEANALLSLSEGAIRVAGPVTSGAIVSTLGFGVVFAVDAVSFVLSFVCLAAMRLPRAVARGERRSMLADAREGFRAVRERRWIVAALGCDAFFNVALAAYFVLGPVVFLEHFGGAGDWALMMTAGAIGSLVGGLVVLRFKPQRPLLAAYVFSFVTPLQIIALAPPLPFAILLVGGLLLAVAIVVSNTSWDTMAQQHVPQRLLSRVDSLAWMVSLIVFPLAQALVGPLSTAIGVQTTLVVAGLLGAAALASALAVPEFRNLRRLDDEPAGEHEPTPAAPLPAELRS